MPRTAIKSVLLFDGHDLKQNATVVFDSDTGNILSVGDATTTLPTDAEVIDGSGHTLLPGLIEAHMHVHGLHLPPGGDESEIIKQPLRCGVTTICDMHSDPEVVNGYRRDIAEEIKQAKSTGKGVTRSDLKSCLYGATIQGGWPKPIVLSHDPSEELKALVDTWPNVTIDNAPQYIQKQIQGGADYIKLMQENCCSLAIPTDSIPVATLELQTAVVNAAHAENLLVVGHALSVDMTTIVLKSGADGLTHTFVDQPPTDAIVNLYKETGAFVIPTLTVLFSLTGEGQELRDKFAEIAYKKGVIDEFTMQNQKEMIGMKAESSKVENAFATIKRLRQEGIDIVAGTDAVAGLKGTAIGPSMWMELNTYVEKCGMSVLDALKSATSVTARRFRFHDRGSIESGKRADMVLVKGDVTQKLENLWEGDGIVGVWKQGLKAVG